MISSLLFGADRLVQNMTLARKKRTPSGAFISITPIMIELDKVLNSLQINRDQLICLGILVGTDYNPGGIKGIGPKKALDLVRKNDSPIEIFKAAAEIKQFDFNWQAIFELFKKPSITEKYSIEFKKPDVDAIKKILVEKHDFSEERIDSALDKLEKQKSALSQKGLGKWF